MGCCACGGEYEKAPAIPSKHFPAFRSELPSMTGKVVVVTGCTSGTGYICAKTCAELGAKVIMLNRPSERAQSALQSVKAASPRGDVSLVACDLMSFASVRKAAVELRQMLSSQGIDVLCNNAGIMGTVDQATEDGCDTQMQTNHLSHFLLTAEVWPLLERAAEKRGEARVVNHSSGARTQGNKKLEAKYLGKNGGNLGGNESGCTPFSGNRWVRYQQSKLANVVFTYALDDKLKAANSKVKALVAHPGLSATNLQVSTAGDGGMGHGFTDWLMRNMAQSGEDGTVPLLTCCCARDVNSRDFYGPARLTGPTVLMQEEKLADEDSQQMLWQQSLTVTGARYKF